MRNIVLLKENTKNQFEVLAEGDFSKSKDVLKKCFKRNFVPSQKNRK
jgi:hypothetical protein